MSDLIRREDVVNVIQRNAFHEGRQWVFRDKIMKELCDLPAANAVPTWISVANKLPETKDPVLCYYLGKDGKHHYSVGYHERYGSYAEAWYVEVECNCAGYGCERVTHWMPLSEPPKMDGGNTDE